VTPRALLQEDRHGYGIMKAVEVDSGGRVTAEIGTLYRVLDRQPRRLATLLGYAYFIA
jgi:hypothetical protein